MPRHINTNSSGLHHHMSVYSKTDAILDAKENNPHLPERELRELARTLLQDERRIPKYVPLRHRIRVA